jgi:hypothetical protein
MRKVNHKRRAAKEASQAKRSVTSAHPLLAKRILSLLTVAGLWGIGVGVMNLAAPAAFEIGLAIAVVAVVASISLFAHEINLFIRGAPETEAGLKNASTETRIAVITILIELFITVYFAVEFAPTPAPLSFVANSTLTDYALGQDVSGIQWRSYYAELGLHLSNDSTTVDYTDVDANFETDLFIVELVQTNGPKCDLFGDTALKIFDAEIRSKDTAGRSFHYHPQIRSVSTTYRVHCSQLSRTATVDFFAAVVNQDFSNNPPPSVSNEGPTLGVPHGPARAAKWASATVSYDAGGRRHSAYFKNQLHLRILH